MKGFTKDGKFHPIKPYNKVRKARDSKEQGVKIERKARLTQSEVDKIKKNVLPLDKTALRIMKHQQGNAKRDRFANPRWNSMTQTERLNALNKSGVHESAMGRKLISRKELSKLSYHQLPHYAKTDLGFNFFNLDKEGVRKARAQASTVFGGVGLFDVGNKVGKWEGDPRTRGVYDLWVHKDTGEELIVEMNEDYYNPKTDTYGYDVIIQDSNTGNLDIIDSTDNYEQALETANEWMKENKKGWE